MHDLKNTDKENYGSGKCFSGKHDGQKLRGLENAGLENDGQTLANCEHNYGVWKMQEYKSSRVQPTHTVYNKEAARDTLQSSTDMSSARPENDGQRKLWVFSN